MQENAQVAVRAVAPWALPRLYRWHAGLGWQVRQSMG